ncbi:MAG TPA: SemiSWEET transporter [Chitinophagaceae bacterium]
MMLTQVIGIAAGVLTGISMLPQLLKLIREKKADAISAVMLVVLIAGLSLWVCYGILRKDWPIIITNTFSWLVNVIMLILRQVYRRSRSRNNSV